MERKWVILIAVVVVFTILALYFIIKSSNKETTNNLENLNEIESEMNWDDYDGEVAASGRSLQQQQQQQPHQQHLPKIGQNLSSFEQQNAKICNFISNTNVKKFKTTIKKSNEVEIFKIEPRNWRDINVSLMNEQINKSHNIELTYYNEEGKFVCRIRLLKDEIYCDSGDGKGEVRRGKFNITTLQNVPLVKLFTIDEKLMAITWSEQKSTIADFENLQNIGFISVKCESANKLMIILRLNG